MTKGEKRRRKRLIEDYNSKKNHDGYVYGNCPGCFLEKKILIPWDSDLYCDVCKSSWSVVA